MSLGALKAWEMIRSLILTDWYATVLRSDSAMIILQPKEVNGNTTVNYFCESMIIKEINH